MGEEVGAFIRLKDKSKPVSRDDIKNFCQGKISHFKIPRYVVTVDEFPRTVSGKIQKFKFFELFEREIKECK
jgi:fatty-acyl-CoA synthase